MLDLFGKGYVIEHCISLFKNKTEEKAFRIYVTDALQAITKDISSVFGGTEMQKRYIEIINPPKQKKTAEEIINGIKEKLGG